MTTGFTGGCLCGAVRYACSAEPGLTGHCHCLDCRRSSGSGHCTHVVVPAAALRVEGEVRLYDRPADSGNLVSRGFCPTCGAPLYSTNDGMPGMIAVRASSLDDPEVARPQVVVFASRAPSWDAVAPGLPAFPGMPEGGPAGVVAGSG